MEQTRREVSLDAEQRAHEAGTTIAEFYEKKLTEVKAELEQAERERDEWTNRANDALAGFEKATRQVERLTDRYEQDQARLAKVPALVEESVERAIAKVTAFDNEMQAIADQVVADAVATWGRE